MTYFVLYITFLFAVWSAGLAVAQSVREAVSSAVEHLGSLFGGEVFATGHSLGYGAFAVVEGHSWFCLLYAEIFFCWLYDK